MDEQLRIDWLKFLEGKWQEKMPDRPGRFPVVDKRDTEGKFHYIVVYLNPSTGRHMPASIWNGWWWSEPLPNLTPAPARKDLKPWV